MSSSNIPVTEAFWSLVDKADKKFSRVKDLPSYGRNRYDSYFHKVFKVYTQLWKFQQENRQKLVESGLKRSEIGEIAYRIAQLYYTQYLRTSDSSCLTESFIFYEAVMDRGYFKDSCQSLGLVHKQLRCIARFILVCLILNRREKVEQSVIQLQMVLEESKKTFQDKDFREWMHVVREIVRFLKADPDFMNIRPLRYSLVLDCHPDSIACSAMEEKRMLTLTDAVLCSYQHNEVKFRELTLDNFRMLQCLEYEPSGSFYRDKNVDLKGNVVDSNESGTYGSNSVGFLEDMTDPCLPPNPAKAVLYRPSATHLIAVVATLCEELPADGIMLVYLSGKGGQTTTRWLTSTEELQSYDVDPGPNSLSSLSSVDESPPASIPEGDQLQTDGDCVWLASSETEGLYCIYPCDLIPFTRKPLFLIVDSSSSHAFKIMIGAEKGERITMILSPISSCPPASGTTEFARYPGGSQFTMFLTAPLQAFCLLVGLSSSSIDMDAYNEADRLFSCSLSEWGTILTTCDSLDPVWARVSSDPFLRRLILRFVFCRAVLSLYAATTYNKKEFLPEIFPELPPSLLPCSPCVQSAVLVIAKVLGVAGQFVFSDNSAALEAQTGLAGLSSSHTKELQEVCEDFSKHRFIAKNGH